MRMRSWDKGSHIGSYSILGRCSIGDRTQIASQVQVLSGRRQHSRDESGQIRGAHDGEFEAIVIGADFWIGASSVIMAAIGAGSTIGAGAVVVRPIPAQVVAVGNPARVIRKQCHSLRGMGIRENMSMYNKMTPAAADEYLIFPNATVSPEVRAASRRRADR